jgi:hypothetical protein
MVLGMVVDFGGLIFQRGGVVFLRGFLRKTVCWMWFFDGEIVVDVW